MSVQQSLSPAQAPEGLADRIQRLEDVEAIKAVTIEYGRAADQRDGVPPNFVENIMKCFTEDCVWDGGLLGRFAGRDGMNTLFDVSEARSITFTVHLFISPIIKIDGDQATGTWKVLALNTFKDEPVWSAGRYDNLYVRTSSGWRIKTMNYDPWMWASHHDGWANARFYEMANGDITG